MNAKKPTLAIFLAAGLLGFGGLAYYVGNSPNSDLPGRNSAQATAKLEEGKAKVFTPKMDGATPVLEEQHLDVPKGEDPAVFSVNEFLTRSHVTPDGAKLLGVDVDPEGVATLSFNQKFRQSYGSTDEKTLLDGIRSSLGQFPKIKRIRFTIEGEILESLGNVDLSEPIDVLPEPADGPSDPAP